MATERKEMSSRATRDRTKHRLFEKSRRQAFNELLMKLSESLPSLDGIEKSHISKHTIVEESVKHHKAQQSEVDALQRRVTNLINERLQLLDEVNAFRQCLDLELRQAWDEPTFDDTVSAGTTTEQQAAMEDMDMEMPSLDPLQAHTAQTDSAQDLFANTQEITAQPFQASFKAILQPTLQSRATTDVPHDMFRSELPKLLNTFTGDPLPLSSPQPQLQDHANSRSQDQRLTEYRTWTAYPSDYGGAGSVQKEVQWA